MSASFTNCETSIPQDRLCGGRLLTDVGGAEGEDWTTTALIVVGIVNGGLRGDRSIGGLVLVRHLKSDCSKIDAQRFCLIPLTKSRHRPKSSGD